MQTRPFTNRRFLAFAVLGGVAALAACGGGGGSSAPTVRITAAPVATLAPSGAGLAPASFSIKIPRSSTSGFSRRTLTVNAATTSISFTLLKTDAAGISASQTPVATFDVSGNSPLCTTVSGVSSCTLGISAPIGNDIYSIQTFDVNGNKLGSGAVNIRVLLNVANTASISLGGTLASVLVTTGVPAGGYSNNYTQLDASGVYGAASLRVYVIGFDNAGNVIVTPDTYSQPISLTFDMPLGQYYSDSKARRPLATALPPPAALALNVTYGSGATSAQTTDIGSAVLVTSPNDIITLTVIQPGPQYWTYTSLLASVGTPPSPLPLPLPSPAAGTLSTLAAIYLEVYPYVPPPTPTPMPAAIVWSADQTGMTGIAPNQSYQFGSATANGTNLTISDTTAGATAMTVTTTDCPATVFAPLPTSAGAMTSGSYTFLFETLAHNGATPAPVSSGPQPTPYPTGGIACHLTATDNVGVSSILTVYVNNIAGTVQ